MLDNDNLCYVSLKKLSHNFKYPSNVCTNLVPRETFKKTYEDNIRTRVVISEANLHLTFDYKRLDITFVMSQLLFKSLMPVLDREVKF